MKRKKKKADKRHGILPEAKALRENPPILRPGRAFQLTCPSAQQLEPTRSLGARGPGRRPDRPPDSSAARADARRRRRREPHDPGPGGRSIPSSRGPRPAQGRVLHPVERRLHRRRRAAPASTTRAERHGLQVMIRQGRAPLHLMNVRYDPARRRQAAAARRELPSLPKIYRPFGGEGRRLGKAPSLARRQRAPATHPRWAPRPRRRRPQLRRRPRPPSTEPSRPSCSASRCPTARGCPPGSTRLHTVNDVYEFVQRASSAVRARP